MLASKARVHQRAISYSHHSQNFLCQKNSTSSNSQSSHPGLSDQQPPPAPSLGTTTSALFPVLILLKQFKSGHSSAQNLMKPFCLTKSKGTIFWKGLRASPGSFSPFSHILRVQVTPWTIRLHAAGVEAFVLAIPAAVSLLSTLVLPRSSLYPPGFNKISGSVRPSLTYLLKIKHTSLNFQSPSLHYLRQYKYSKTVCYTNLFCLWSLSFHENISSLWAGIWIYSVHYGIFRT